MNDGGGRRPRRERLAQAVVFAIVAVILVGLALALVERLEAQGIQTGFAFLWAPAGFDIPLRLIPFDTASSNARAFLVALLNTLLVSATAIVVSTALGTLLGVARLSGNLLLPRLGFLYVELVRNLPLLLQLFLWYFVVLRALPPPRGSIAILDAFFLNNRGLFVPVFDAVPLAPVFGLAIATAVGTWLVSRRRKFLWAPIAGVLTGLAVAVFTADWHPPHLSGFNFRGGVAIPPELVALVAALSFYTAAPIGEIIRAAIQSIPKGQTEAAAALGLTRRASFRLVILPQALRRVAPPLANQYLHLIRNSSLGAAIAFPELTSVFAGTVLNQTGHAVEAVGMTMAAYLTIGLTVTSMMRRLEVSGRDP